LTGGSGRIGLISDTHGLLRPEALAFLEGSSLIIHGGDIGSAAILERLRLIAPVIAVRGNNDTGPWAEALSEVEDVVLDEVRICAIHDRSLLKARVAEPGAVAGVPGRRVQVVVSGHSHRPQVEEREAILFVNPGSAGPRRFKLPISVGELWVERGTVQARIVELEVNR
jgi:putative phosphoesterase